MIKNSDSGSYGRTVPDNDPRDTRPDLKDTDVIVDVRFRDGRVFTGWKEYVSREQWASADRETRKAIIAGVTEKLLTALEGTGR